MPNLKSIKTRINSVKNTKKVTKTMELISAIKFQKSFAEISIIKEFLNKLEMLIQEVVQYQKKTEQSDEFQRINKEVWLIVSSDRGLSGEFLNNIKRSLIQNLRNKSNNEIEFILVGKKTSLILKKLGFNILETHSKVDHTSFLEFSEILKNKLKQYHNMKHQIKILYTEFSSNGRNEVRIQDLFDSQKEIDFLKLHKDSKFKFESSTEEVVNFVLDEIVKIRILNALKNSNVSENFARMIAMKNATDSAGDIIKFLQIEYNKKRQNIITQEIAEILGGMTGIADSTILKSKKVIITV